MILRGEMYFAVSENDFAVVKSILPLVKLISPWRNRFCPD